MSEKVKDFFRLYIGYIMVAIVSIVYVCASFIQIGNTGKDFSQIIGDGVVVFLLGFFINRVFDMQGIINGENNERYKNTLLLHGESVIKISAYIEKLDDWCKLKNAENLKIQRTRVLANEGLSYDAYFDENGSSKGFTVNKEALKDKYLRADELRRIKCYKKALRLKLTPITASDLTSDGTHKSADPYNFGRTKEQYIREGSVLDVLFKIGIAVIVGYYGVELIQDFSYANLIWNTLQVALFVLMGSLKMHNSYLFIVGEYRGRIVQKINQLDMFWNYIQNKGE